MKTLLEINEKKVPAVRIDRTLDEYDGKVVFADKLAEANDRIAKSGFPNLPVRTNSRQHGFGTSGAEE